MPCFEARFEKDIGQLLCRYFAIEQLVDDEGVDDGDPSASVGVKMRLGYHQG